MESDETKSVQQPQSPTLNQIDSKAPTLQIGISPLPQKSSSGESNPPPGLWAGLRLPIKRVGWIIQSSQRCKRQPNNQETSHN